MMMGKNIKKARKRIGFTQEELAAQIGVTAQAVSRWESEAGMPDVSLIVPLAQVLRVSTDTLFGMNQAEQEQDLYMEIRAAYEKIESEEKKPAEDFSEMFTSTFCAQICVRKNMRKLSNIGLS